VRYGQEDATVLVATGAVMVDFLLAMGMCATVGVVGWVAVEIERRLL
jgi:hypothetical protein